MKTVKLPQGTLSIDANEFLVIDNKKNEPQYKAVSDFVGGMVECVQFPNGDLLLLNEEGKLMGLPLNPEATALWRSHFTKDKGVTQCQINIFAKDLTVIPIRQQIGF